MLDLFGAGCGDSGEASDPCAKLFLDPLEILGKAREAAGLLTDGGAGGPHVVHDVARLATIFITRCHLGQRIRSLEEAKENSTGRELLSFYTSRIGPPRHAEKGDRRM